MFLATKITAFKTIEKNDNKMNLPTKLEIQAL